MITLEQLKEALREAYTKGDYELVERLTKMIEERNEIQ
jgi:hypothetical protein